MLPTDSELIKSFSRKDIARFWNRVEIGTEESCWPWMGYLHETGAGRIKHRGIKLYAHRVAYQLVKGEPPRGFQVIHECKNRVCVNPQHLKSEYEDQFWAYVDKGESCWIWNGSRTKAGYGVFGLAGQKDYAHRIAYKLIIGPIAAKQYICHHCDNPPCVNPDHLFLGTPTDNLLDCLNKKRMPLGENRKNSKLTANKVRKIRELYSGGLNLYRLAKRFKVHRMTIRDALDRKTWKHI